MRASLPLTLLACLVFFGSCNVWDNIFSETRATTPIVFQQSFNVNFPFEFQEYDLEATIDFNEQLQVVSIIVKKPILITSITVGNLQFRLDNMLIEVKPFGVPCRRYQLEFLQFENPQGLNKEQVKGKIFLANIFFQFVGFTKKDQKYRLSPDILTRHSKDHQEYEINPIVIVDKSGSILHVYQDDKMKTQYPFEGISVVNQRLDCLDAPIEVINRQKFKDIAAEQFTPQNIDSLKDMSGLDMPDVEGLEDNEIEEIIKGLINGEGVDFDQLQDQLPDGLPDIDDLPDLDDLPEIPNIPGLPKIPGFGK